MRQWGRSFFILISSFLPKLVVYLPACFAGLNAHDLGLFSKVKSTFKEQRFVSFVKVSKNCSPPTPLVQKAVFNHLQNCEVYGIWNRLLLKRVLGCTNLGLLTKSATFLYNYSSFGAFEHLWLYFLKLLYIYWWKISFCFSYCWF